MEQRIPWRKNTGEKHKENETDPWNKKKETKIPETKISGEQPMENKCLDNNP